MDESAVSRFWSKVAVGEPDACWHWMRSGASGYGTTTFNGRRTTATRVAYALSVGPVPDNMLVCHKCDNPPCCNPAHLFLGDDAANMADCASKDRTTFGLRSRHARLTNEIVVAVRTEYALGGVTIKELAARHGIGAPSMRAVLQFRAWARSGGPVADPDVLAAGRNAEGINGSAKLTETQRDEIRSIYAAGGVSQKELGRRYGVSGPLVCLLTRGR